MSIIRVIVLTALLAPASETQIIIMPIVASDAVKVAQMIARDQGYDIRNDKMYYFDMDCSCMEPLAPGYTTIAFYFNGWIQNTISISDATGQAIDFNGCEVFDYPDLRPFQQNVMKVNKTKKKSPDELAQDVGCSHPIVLKRPHAVAKQK
jgi:hypothetical protein